jgi:hypothetical protein
MRNESVTATPLDCLNADADTISDLFVCPQFSF